MEITRDISRGEATEKELDTLIRKRHEHRVLEEGERPEEMMWKASVRRFHQRRRREMVARWYTFHADMHDLHSRLAAEHQQKALRLLEEGE